MEQFGLEAIPEQLKTVAWYDLFLIIVNFLINPASILIGGMSVAAGLSFWAAVTAQTLGCAIAFAAYITIATIGVDYGLPGQVATRATFGLRGAKWMPSLLRVLASTYWFAFQTIAGSLVIVDILDRFLGGHHSLRLISAFFGLGQVVVAVWGYQSLKFLSRIAFPFKVGILMLLWIGLARYHDPNFHPAHVFHYRGTLGWRWTVFAVWTNAMVSGWIVMITDAADFCRYSRSRMDMWVGTTSAAWAAPLFCALLGAYGAAATLGKVSNFFVVVTSHDSRPFTLMAVLIVVVLDNWTINVLNLYTGGLSVSNIFENVGRFWTTLAVGVVSILLSAFPGLVSGYLHYTSTLGESHCSGCRRPARGLSLHPKAAPAVSRAFRSKWSLLVLERVQPARDCMGLGGLWALFSNAGFLDSDSHHRAVDRDRIFCNRPAYRNKEDAMIPVANL